MFNNELLFVFFFLIFNFSKYESFLTFSIFFGSTLFFLPPLELLMLSFSFASSLISLLSKFFLLLLLDNNASFNEFILLSSFILLLKADMLFVRLFPKIDDLPIFVLFRRLFPKIDDLPLFVLFPKIDDFSIFVRLFPKTDDLPLFKLLVNPNPPPKIEFLNLDFVTPRLESTTSFSFWTGVSFSIFFVYLSSFSFLEYLSSFSFFVYLSSFS